jgi:hypothetical protein
LAANDYAWTPQRVNRRISALPQRAAVFSQIVTGLSFTNATRMSAQKALTAAVAPWRCSSTAKCR